jgi:ATP-dependent protease ClpP protease subunit
MRTLLLIAATLLGLSAQADIDPKRLLYIDQPITRGTLQPVHTAFEKFIATSKEPITLVLSSPGGSVVAGMSFINMMASAKAMGISINCYVLDMAASMAFQILTQCNERHALATSYLLWHGVRTGYDGPITTAVAASLAEDLAMMDEIVMDQLTSTLRLSQEQIKYHFDRETLWAAKQLADRDSRFIKIHQHYAQLIPLLPQSIRSAQPFSFLFGMDGIVYIWERFLPTVSEGVKK